MRAEIIAHHQHQNACNTKKILRGINFVKITKIFSSVDPESGHSCLVFVQYPRDSPRSAWELQKKSVPQRIPVKITKKITQTKPGGELICKNFGANGTCFIWRGLNIRERPLGLIQHVLTVLIFLSWCCSCPGLHLRLGASDCVPGLAFCFMGP